jgi:hypothetical protein
MANLRRLAAVAVVAVLGTTGCSGDAAPARELIQIQRPATLQDLVGPWQAAPFALDPAFRATVAATCRRDIEFGVGSVPSVMDARGAGVVTVRMTGPESGSCDALEIAGNGQVSGAGGGWRGGKTDAKALEPGQLSAIETQSVEGGNLKVQGWSVYGRAGPGIAAVRVETVTGVVVTATLEGGWFAAWWPQPLDPMRDPARQSFALRAYDMGGVLVDEHVQ